MSSNRGERRRAEREKDTEAAQRVREANALKQAKQAEHLALAAELLLGGEYFARQANEEDPCADRLDDSDPEDTDSAHRANVNTGPTFKDGVKIPRSYQEAVNDPKYGHKWREAIHAEL